MYERCMYAYHLIYTLHIHTFLICTTHTRIFFILHFLYAYTCVYQIILYMYV